MQSSPTRRLWTSRAPARCLVLALALALGLRPPAVAQELPAATQQLPPPPTQEPPAATQELPTLGEVAADELTAAQERKFGEQIMVEVRDDPGYMPDPDATEYLNRLGYELVAASQARHIDFEFFLMRDPMINAFALPGGFIGVHSGTILTAQSESELASVMGHEIGHVQQRHIARMIARQRESLAITIGSLLLALLAARGGGGQGAEAALAVGQAAAIQRQLSFSRDNEREADRVGFDILVNAGFDPRAMAAFFTRMQNGTRIYESIAPAYLRTHPLSVERISDIQGRLRGVRTHQHADSLDFDLVRARLRVLQDDSKQGAEDALTYFSDQLQHHTAANDVAAYYGLALAQLKLKQSRSALDSALAARRGTQGSSAILDKLVAEASFQAATNDSERDAALKLARDATARFPLSRLTAIEYADVLQRAGQHRQAIDYLRDQLGLTHSDPRYFQMLAASHAALQQKTLQHQATAEMYVLQGAVPAAVEQLRLARSAADADFYTMSEVDARLRQLNGQIREQRKEAGKKDPGPDDEDSTANKLQGRGLAD
ncbi:MAG TPA: M48 family metalloprotease [Burkholderiaceae bacterium]|nr:M48 family metalloprotease [Burkholderiaceae bacterium]